MEKPPSLPLARDILQRAATTRAEYIVLTLADISLMPNFYEEATQLGKFSGWPDHRHGWSIAKRLTVRSPKMGPGLPFSHCGNGLGFSIEIAMVMLG